MMNLKEAFRFQKFLDGLLNNATSRMTIIGQCFKVTKLHKCSKVNPETDDFVETVEEEELILNDDILDFIEYLINLKNELTREINKTKTALEDDIDAMAESNKYRHNAHYAISNMLKRKPSARVENGYGYKFNAEGNQTQYRYDVEVTSEDNFDRSKAKELMRRIISEADDISSKIDTAKVNAMVNFEAPFDVNDSFEDAIAVFLENKEVRAE